MIAHRYFFALAGLFFASSSVYAATTTAENYLGMLIEKDEYVRLQDCSKQIEYTLVPSGKYGYDAIAELISLRKNTAVSIPISVSLNGSIEENINNNKNRYFLVNDISSVKTGESCYIVPAEQMETAQVNDVGKQNSSEKMAGEEKTTSQPDLGIQTVPLVESQIKNENISAPLNQQKTVEVPLDKIEQARIQTDIQTGNGDMVEQATESSKLKEGVDTNQPNIIYEAAESFFPVRSMVDPLDLP